MMSRGRFTGGGSFGPSPTNYWFGTLADNMSMVVKAQEFGNPIGVTPVLYGNQMGVSNGSFGAFTTAPDGTTNTAQLFTEDTSLNHHSLSANTLAFTTGLATLGSLRFAAILKYAGRRVTFHTNCNAPPGNMAFECTFDLLNGVVGVAPNIISPQGTRPGFRGPFFEAVGTSITALPNGFYLCTFDYNYICGDNNQIIVTLLLDNGVGNAAASVQYTGNGTSGVYVWRVSLMPIPAYGVNNNTLFDDFTSLNTIDVTNTKAAGFNWYVNNAWSGYQSPAATPNGTFSIVSGTQLQVPAYVQSGLSSEGMVLGTAAQLNAAAGTFVGRGYKPPFYVEFRAALPDIYTIKETTTRPVLYVMSLDWLAARGTSSPLTTGLRNMICKGDPGFGGSDVATAVSTPILSNVFRDLNLHYQSRGIPLWNSLHAYIGSQVSATTWVSGTSYVVKNLTSTVGLSPPNAEWNTYTYLAVGGIPAAPNFPFDYSAFHTYGILVLPVIGPGAQGPAWNSNASAGMIMYFVDGVLIANDPYGPYCGFNDYRYGDVIMDQQYPFQQLCDTHSFGVFVGAGAHVRWLIDYIKVMQ